MFCVCVGGEKNLVGVVGTAVFVLLVTSVESGTWSQDGEVEGTDRVKLVHHQKTTSVCADASCGLSTLKQTFPSMQGGGGAWSSGGRRGGAFAGLTVGVICRLMAVSWTG